MRSDFQEAIVTQECIECGVTFAITTTFEAHLRKTLRNFNCPNGHLMSYKGQLEIEKLQERIAWLEGEMAKRDTAAIERRAALNKEIAALIAHNRSLRGVITKLKKAKGAK